MLNKLLLFLFILPIFGYAQTTVYSDNMESVGFTWKGIPKSLTNSSYVGGFALPTDAPASAPQYASLDTSFRLLGVGAGSSAQERDTLVYPNVTGLDPNSFYQLKFKVASIAYNPTPSLPSGVDAPDFVELQYSINNGVTFIREIRLIGNSNSYWGFGAGAGVNKNATGALSTYTSSTASPISVISLNLPLGITQASFQIIMLLNGGGESWLIDDVELIKLTSLPIDLLSFEGEYINNESQIAWATASEINNSYFTLLVSDDGVNYSKVTNIEGAGNSTFTKLYSYSYKQSCYNGVLYYILQQYDFDNTLTEYGPIAIPCVKTFVKTPIKTFNMMGQEVDSIYIGPKITLYNDNTFTKTFNIN